jgi:holliday junction DNA helicase RuvA
MFAYISGKLDYKSPRYVILDVGGVGFCIFTPLSTYCKLPETGEMVKLFMHLHVREDVILLYGFKTNGEKETFEMLISVSGIGPKLAISVLSELSVEEFKSAIMSNDPKTFTSISGVGKKIGQRILLELKEKVVFLPGKEPKDAGRKGLIDDAVSALVSLGYTQSSSADAIKKIFESSKEEILLEDLIKKALKELK